MKIIWPSFSTACACFIEIVLIMEFVDDDTDGGENRFPNRNIFAFGVANLICGLFGTMGF
jgi:MFS superfamily sulfate permease-like transporter